MAERYRLTSVDTVAGEGSWLFTVRDERGNDEEVFLVPCERDDDYLHEGPASGDGDGDGPSSTSHLQL